MKNITLAVEDDVLQGARRYAAARNTSVNGIVRDYLRQIASQDERIEEARKRLRELSDASPSRLGAQGWNRDSLYDR